MNSGGVREFHRWPTGRKGCNHLGGAFKRSKCQNWPEGDFLERVRLDQINVPLWPWKAGCCFIYRTHTRSVEDDEGLCCFMSCVSTKLQTPFSHISHLTEEETTSVSTGPPSASTQVMFQEVISVLVQPKFSPSLTGGVRTEAVGLRGLWGPSR